MILLLKEYKDYFAWNYDEMPRLSRALVELKLPIKPGKKPIKQIPRSFAPEIMSKIKEEIERLLRLSSSVQPGMLTGLLILALL